MSDDERPLSSLKILHSMRDQRIDAQTTIVSISISDYLRLTDTSEENLEIQRRILPRKNYYDRLRADMRRGGTIPPIVLAVAEEAGVEHQDEGAPEEGSLQALTPERIYIVDGLQRTNHIRILLRELTREGADEEKEVFLNQTVRIELWTDISFPSILYRMMLLNAAQTPMTLRHQLEIVNYHLIRVMKDVDEKIEIFRDKDPRRRYSPLQYQAADLVEGFTAFIKRTPFIESKAAVLEELDQDDFIANFDEVKYKEDIASFIVLLGGVDEALSEKYAEDVPGVDYEPKRGIKKGVNFFSSKPYLLGFCAAAGFAASRLEAEVFKSRVKRLRDLLKSERPDPAGFLTFHKLIGDAVTSAGKVGDAQREFVFQGFKGYLLDAEPCEDLGDYWIEAARRI